MPLFIQEALNIYIGNDTANNSKHLQIESAKLPTLEEISQDHHAGGAIGEISVGGLGIKKLEATFKLKGHDPQSLVEFGVYSRGRMPFTIYGLIRDKKGNQPIELKAVIEARFGKIESDDFKRGDLLGHDYMLHEIWHYELWFDKQEKIYFDFLSSDWRVNGVSQNTAERNILRIPGAA